MLIFFKIKERNGFFRINKGIIKIEELNKSFDYNDNNAFYFAKKNEEQIKKEIEFEIKKNKGQVNRRIDYLSELLNIKQKYKSENFDKLKKYKLLYFTYGSFISFSKQLNLDI